VGTNDWHGWVKPHLSKLPDGTELAEGGASVFSSYVAALRADNPGGVLLLDAGDLFQGTLVSNLTEGTVVIDAFNLLGYTAAAIGNHEFDYGPLGPVSVAAEPGQDPFGALKARIAQAHFPMLGVNLYEAATGNRPSWLGNDGTAMIEVQGIKVGLIGLTTPSTPTTTNPVNVQTLRFGSLVPEAQAAARKLRQLGAEVVIAVAHAGAKCASYQDPHDVSSCDANTSEMFDLLNGLPEGTLDAVIAGHTHAPLGHFVHGTPVIETWGLGRSFGVITLYVDPASRKVLKDKTSIQADISICPVEDATTHRCDAVSLSHSSAPIKLQKTAFLGHPIEADPAMDKLLAPAFAKVEAEQRRQLGVETSQHLGRNYEAESALGSVLADSLRQMEDADVALLNSGGLRADLPAGKLTFGDLYEVLPFDNTIATLKVSGKDLKRLLQQAYGARKGVFQISGANIKLGQCPGQGRLKTVTLGDGNGIDPAKTYKVVLPDFLARGGDGLGPVIASLGPGAVDLGVNRPLNFRDQLIRYWQKHTQHLAAPKPGRLEFVDDGSHCTAGAKLNIQPAPGAP
jgi:5'-nucleotidase